MLYFLLNAVGFVLLAMVALQSGVWWTSRTDLPSGCKPSWRL
jgi:hypothetical protein